MIIHETLKIFLENVYDRVFLVKLLACSVQTATLSIKRLPHIRNIYRKLAVLKRIFLQKSLW